MTVEERFPTLIQLVDYLRSKDEDVLECHALADQLLASLGYATDVLNSDEGCDDSGS